MQSLYAHRMLLVDLFLFLFYFMGLVLLEARLLMSGGLGTHGPARLVGWPGLSPATPKVGPGLGW